MNNIKIFECFTEFDVISATLFNYFDIYCKKSFSRKLISFSFVICPNANQKWMKP
jgi:hypothetical protein